MSAAAPIDTSAAPAEVAAQAAATPSAPATPSPAEQAGFPPLKAAAPPAPTQPATPAAQPSGAPMPAWMEGLSSDEIAFAQAKGWHKDGKGPADIMRSYRNLERLRGVEADRLVKIPDPKNAEEVAQFRSRLGVPETVEGYTNHDVETPTGVLRADLIANISHKIGATPEQHAALLDATGELVRNLFQTEAEDAARRNAAELVDLKREWGPKFDEYNQAVDSAVVQLGLDEEFVEALKIAGGEAKARRVLAQIGLKLGEHKRPAESSIPSLMTTEVAKARIDALKKDSAFYARLTSGDADARREWEQLLSIVAG